LPINRLSTISLIGMPGAGKSTVGVILAKQIGLRFIDTDLDIQQHEQATLQEILEARGYEYLRQLEQQVLLDIPLTQAVISTGGSVVYSADVMARLMDAGPVVYLQCSLDTLEARVAAAPPRGIASRQNISFKEVYAERTPLYEHYGQFQVDAGGGCAETVAAEILQQLR
jgi:shikimate kinase